MRPIFPNNIWVAIAVLAAPFIQANEGYTPQSETEQLAIIRSWLPMSSGRLHLLFEYDREENRDTPPTSVELHRAIDRAGPTVTILEAKTPYDRSLRIVGGYNPYKWKSVFGKYERSPGRFIFDLGRNRKWERLEYRKGRIKRDSAKYGLMFGEGDIVINPDLQSGSARNRTFGPPDKNASVLFGQSGEFEVHSIRVYGIRKQPDSVAPSIPLHSHYLDSSEQPVSVPDHSLYLFEITLSLFSLSYLVFLQARHKKRRP